MSDTKAARTEARTDTIVKVVLVFFISLLSFSIGTFVGKKFSDNQHRLAAMDPNAHAANGHEGAVAETSHEGPAAEANREVASTHEQGAPSDEQLAKMAEEFVKDDPTTAHQPAASEHAPAAHEPEHTAAAPHAPEHSAPAATPTHAPAAAATAHKVEAPAVAKKDVLAEVAAKLAAGEPTHEAPKAVAGPRFPTSLPKDVAQSGLGKFTVQIAAFQTEVEATKRAAELKQMGYSAFYTPATVNGQSWFRVNVGLFTTAKEAQEFKSELSVKANISSSIIQKIVQ